MTQSDVSKGPLRYRLYFWLMDAASVIVVIGLAGVFFDAVTGIKYLGLPLPIARAVGVVIDIFGGVIPALLIVARPMRDEYAEMLWKRTVGNLVWLIAIAPIVIFSLLWIAYLLIGGTERPESLSLLYDEAPPVLIMIWSWTVFVVLFVLIFQFNRWRDSR